MDANVKCRIVGYDSNPWVPRYILHSDQKLFFTGLTAAAFKGQRTCCDNLHSKHLSVHVISSTSFEKTRALTSLQFSLALRRLIMSLYWVVMQGRGRVSTSSLSAVKRRETWCNKNATWQRIPPRGVKVCLVFPAAISHQLVGDLKLQALRQTRGFVFTLLTVKYCLKVALKSKTSMI